MKNPACSIEQAGLIWWAQQGLNLRPLRCEH